MYAPVLHSRNSRLAKSDWQITVIRAAMSIEDVDGYITNPEIEIQKIFTIIDNAIEEGLHVIIYWHGRHAEDYDIRGYPAPFSVFIRVGIVIPKWN